MKTYWIKVLRQYQADAAAHRAAGDWETGNRCQEVAERIRDVLAKRYGHGY